MSDSAATTSGRFAGDELEALARESDLPTIVALAEELLETQEALIDVRLSLAACRRERDAFEQRLHAYKSGERIA